MINQNYILILYLDDAHQQQDIIFGYIMAQQVKNLPTMQETQEMQAQSLGQEDPLEKKQQPTPVFLPGKLYEQRSLVGYSSKGHKKSDMTETKYTHIPNTRSYPIVFYVSFDKLPQI